MPAREISAAVTCATCSDSGWVCERHPERPWDGDDACRCGATGALPGLQCRQRRRRATDAVWIYKPARQEGLAASIRLACSDPRDLI
jgi:hypothetical protein